MIVNIAGKESQVSECAQHKSGTTAKLHTGCSYVTFRIGHNLPVRNEALPEVTKNYQEI